MNYFLRWTFTDSLTMTKTMTDTEWSDGYYYPKLSWHMQAKEKLMKKKMSYYTMTLSESLISLALIQPPSINVVRHN